MRRGRYRCCFLIFKDVCRCLFVIAIITIIVVILVVVIATILIAIITVAVVMVIRLRSLLTKKYTADRKEIMFWNYFSITQAIFKKYTNEV